MTADRPLTLDITDCGPVARGCVELRPLTVFVGPSNTGKSWLATLAYALSRHFGNHPLGWRPWWFDAPALSDDVTNELAGIAERLSTPASRGAELPTEGIDLTPPVEAAIRLHLERQGEAIGEEVERCFGVDDGRRLVRKGSPGCVRILLRHAIEGVSTKASHELTFADQEWTFRPTIPEGFRIRLGNPYGRWLADLLFAEEESHRREAKVWNAIGVLAHALLPNRHPAFYLPADRTGLMNALDTITRTLIRSATKPGVRGTDSVRPISGVGGDFLEQLVEMVANRRQRLRRGSEHLEVIAKDVEVKILSGEVKIGGLSGVPYPQFLYRPIGWETDLPLTNASSMVSEIAPVVLYLRHVVARGNLLIIDEPESHLHPAMQVAFTRQIAAIVRAGVRVIVTTHSEWVLEELGNVLGRGRLAEDGAENTDSVSLGTDDVGVWLFQPSAGGGSTVKEIAMDADTGLYPSGYATVAAALHNAWAAIAEPRGDAE